MLGAFAVIPQIRGHRAHQGYNGALVLPKRIESDVAQQATSSRKIGQGTPVCNFLSPIGSQCCCYEGKYLRSCQTSMHRCSRGVVNLR